MQFFSASEDSLSELNAKGIKKLQNFIRKEEERETWSVVGVWFGEVM